MGGNSGADTRRAVLDATLRIVGDGGLGAVTLARVGAGSGVSNGSIYHHFGSREGVLRGLFVECFGALTGTLERALDDRPAEVCVRDLVGRHLAWVVAEPGRATVVYGVPLDGATVVGSVTTKRDKDAAAAPLVEWFDQRASAGDLRSLPSWAYDPVVLGPVHEVARRWLASRAPDLDEVADVVANAVWAVVAPV